MKWLARKKEYYGKYCDKNADFRRRTNKQTAEVIRTIGDCFSKDSHALSIGCNTYTLHFDIDIAKLDEGTVVYSVRKEYLPPNIRNLRDLGLLSIEGIDDDK